LEQNAYELTKKVPNIKKILLFGSYAKERAHFGSDVDLLIVVSERTKNDFEKIYETLFDLSIEYEWSPLILSEDRFNELKKTHNNFFKNALEEGIVIWSER
jgi:predicted nucleotidyltransferase